MTKIYNDNMGLGYATTGNKVLDFYAIVGSIDRDPTLEDVCRITEKMLEACTDDHVKTAIILFWLRDARNGVGHRELFRKLFSRYIASLMVMNHDSLTPYVPSRSVVNLVGLLLSVPSYGRYDDLFYVLHNLVNTGEQPQSGQYGSALRMVVIRKVIDFIAILLNAAMNDIEPDFAEYLTINGFGDKFDQLIKSHIEFTPILGKWLPSVNTSSSETVSLAKWLISELRKSKYLPNNFNAKNYRQICSKLRKQADIVEHYITTSRYSEINYSAVPSLANMKYADAFRANDKERYAAFLQQVAEGTAKINTSTINAVDIIRQAIEGSPCDIFWNNLPNIPCNSLVCMDGSGSMYSSVGSIKPIDVATALTLYCAEHNEVYKNQFLTFGGNVKFSTIEGVILLDKIRSIRKCCDCRNTNFAAIFDELLKHAKLYNLKPEQMVKSIIVVSDMQFDAAFETDLEKQETVWETISRKYAEAGYTPPKMIFWNVDSRVALPICMNNIGTTITSGWSQNTLRYIMETGDINPESIMNEVLNSPNYSGLYEWFK